MFGSRFIDILSESTFPDWLRTILSQKLFFFSDYGHSFFKLHMNYTYWSYYILFFPLLVMWIKQLTMRWKGVLFNVFRISRIEKLVKQQASPVHAYEYNSSNNQNLISYVVAHRKSSSKLYDFICILFFIFLKAWIHISVFRGTCVEVNACKLVDCKLRDNFPKLWRIPNTNFWLIIL